MQRQVQGPGPSVLPLAPPSLFFGSETAPAVGGSGRVLNDNGDIFRSVDATPHADVLCACVQRTVEHDSCEETLSHRRYDRFRRKVGAIPGMLDRTLNLLSRFLHQTRCKLPARARVRELSALTGPEAAIIVGVFL